MINIDALETKKADRSEKSLLNSNVEIIDFSKVLVKDYVLIDENTEMRMDLISIAAYGTSNYIREIAKFNGIGDVRRLKKGDVIAIPELSSLKTATKVKNIKPIPLQKKSLLGITSKQNSSSANSSSSKSTPSKKKSQSANYLKKENGVLIF